jgi:hypothetical protein
VAVWEKIKAKGRSKNAKVKTENGRQRTEDRKSKGLKI